MHNLIIWLRQHIGQPFREPLGAKATATNRVWKYAALKLADSETSTYKASSALDTKPSKDWKFFSNFGPDRPILAFSNVRLEKRIQNKVLSIG